MNLVSYDDFEKQVLWHHFNKVQPRLIEWSDVLSLKRKNYQSDLLSTNAPNTLIEPSKEYVLKIKNSSFYKEYKTFSKGVLYHNNHQKFSHLYTLFCKLGIDPRLINNVLDPNVKELKNYKRQISRDIHKMHAFVRFNKISIDNKDVFVANHIPDHHIIKKGSLHFVERFSDMNWIIYSNDQMVLWDKKELKYTEGDFSDLSFKEDDFIDLWKTYYANIFNPARVKVKAMKNEMPVRYWSKMPETELISKLLQEAPKKVDEMFKSHENAINMDDFIPKKLSATNFKYSVSKCTACKLGCNTLAQKELKLKSKYVLLFQKLPTHQEEIHLKTLFYNNRLNWSDFHITSITKHESRVRDVSSVMICRRWLVEELILINPEVLICLGKVTVHSVFGYPAFETKMLGQFHQTALCDKTLVEAKFEQLDVKRLANRLNMLKISNNSYRKCLTDIS